MRIYFRPSIRLVNIVFYLLWATPVYLNPGYAGEVKTNNASGDYLVIHFVDNMLSVKIENAPLSRVLTALSGHTDLQVFSEVPLTHRLSLELSDVSISRGLHLMLSGLNFAIERRGSSATSVYILSYQEGSSGTARASGQATLLNQDGAPDFLTELLPENNGIPLQALYDLDPDVRVGAIQKILSKGTKQDINLIYPLLNDQSEQVRAAAITGISLNTGEQSIPYLQQLATDSSVVVRETAFELAQDLDSEKSVAVLVKGMHDADREIQAHAIQSLAESATREAVLALQNGWVQGGQQARDLILLSLPDFENDASFKLLSMALEDSESRVRRQAVEIAAEMDTLAVIPLIRPALDDSDANVRRAARATMEEYGQH